MIPGKAFGETTGDHYVRLAATQSMPMLKEAFDRIEQFTFINKNPSATRVIEPFAKS